jgi:hypothetical protein
MLEGEGLRRHRTWRPAGRFRLGESPAVQSDHPAIVKAVLAWRAVEVTIRDKTEIFV